MNKPNEEFLLIETVPSDLSASGEGNPTPVRPRVIGLAYGGGKISLPGWKHPVVVDLAGLTLPESVPLLANHENRTTARIGVVSARVVRDALEIEGEIVASGDVAGEIVAQAKGGADWQLSIGAEVKASELVRSGVKRNVNGQAQEGPFYHIQQAVLREVSVVAVGADGATRLKIAAQFNLTGGPNMADENSKDEAFSQWLKDSGIAAEGMAAPALAKLRLAFEAEQQAVGDGLSAVGTATTPAAEAVPTAQSLPPKVGGLVPAAPREPTLDAEAIRAEGAKAERERVRAIREMCGRRVKLADEAIEAGWDLDYAGRKLLAEVNSEKPQGNQLAGGYKPLPTDLDQRFLEASLCRKAQFGDDYIASKYGNQIADRVCRGNGVGLTHLFRVAAKMGGHHGDGDFDDEMLYAALNSTRVNAGFTGFSLPGILSNVANKVMMRAFEALQPVAPRLCRESSVNDFKERECFRMTEVGELEELGPDGEIKHGSLTEERTTISAITHAKMYGIPRKWIVNDDMGAFEGLFSGLGANAAKSLDQVFFRRLMSNPNGLFSTAHGNYFDGPDSALTPDGLQKGRELFQLQTDVAGKPILLAPKYLLVPVALEMQAAEILYSTTVIAVGADNKRRIPTDNPLSRVGLTHIVSPYLELPSYPGNSRKSWYLFADPSQCDTFEIVYLYGRKRPTVQTAEADFNQLGMQIRVFWDFGVKEKDHRGIVKSKGEA